MLCAVAALWLEHRTLNQENPGSDPLAAVSKLWQFHSFHVAPGYSALDEHLL